MAIVSLVYCTYKADFTPALLRKSSSFLGFSLSFLGFSLGLFSLYLRLFALDHLSVGRHDLSVLVDSLRIDTVDPPLKDWGQRCPSQRLVATCLVQKDAEDDIISKAAKSVQPWHLDTESKPGREW